MYHSVLPFTLNFPCSFSPFPLPISPTQVLNRQEGVLCDRAYFLDSDMSDCLQRYGLVSKSSVRLDSCYKTISARLLKINVSREGTAILVRENVVRAVQCIARHMHVDGWKNQVKGGDGLRRMACHQGTSQLHQRMVLWCNTALHATTRVHPSRSHSPFTPPPP